MKYLILISHNEQARDAWQGMSDTERQLGVKAHTALVEELAATGELIVSEALADPATARRVRVDRGRTIATDGPFAEVKEYLAGFYLVECADIDEAVAHRRPGAGGAVRPGRGAAGPRRRRLGRVTVTTPASRTCCASSRRRCSAALVRRHGGFDTCEDAVQEALLAAAVQWPDEGVPDNPRGWLITVASRRWIELWRSERRPPAPGARRRPR